MVRGALLGVLLLGSGCVKRVTLTAPPADAPREERVDAWVALRPVDASGTAYVTSQHPDRPVVSDLDSLVLGSGVEVRDPRDLLTVVLPDSETARAVAAWERETRRWNVHGLVALGMLGIGSFGLVLLPALGQDEPSRQALALVAAGVAVLSQVVNLVTAALGGEQPQQAKLRAFRAYQADLRARLGSP